MRPILLAGLALLVLGCGAPEDDAWTAPSLQAEPAAEASLSLSPPPAAELSPFERAVGERMEAVAGTIVEVEVWASDDVVSHGSGVLVSPEGHVLTAAHVVKDTARRFRVVLPDGQSRPAEAVARDEIHDAALLHAPGEPTAFARPAARPPKAGDWVVCAGHGGQVPGERVPMRSAGVVVERPFAWTVTEYEEGTRYPTARKTTTLQGMLRLDCATAPGMSGGPVVDLDGDLVGVAVGSQGVATPIEAIRHLLPRAARAPEAAAPPPPAAPAQVAGDDDGRPSRTASMDAMFASLGVERSLVELEVPDGIGEKHHFAAVLVSADGLVVAPSVWLVKPAEPGAAVAVTDVTVVGYPGAQCAEIVAIQGELALLRLSGLHVPALEGSADVEDGLRPVGPAGAAAVGAIVAAVDTAGAPRSVGFVTAVGRHPGTVAPDGPRWGCGMIRGRFRLANPAVAVTSALAHDAGWPRFGSLLVDRSGRPVALAVANRAPGLAFAVPWPEVMARFDAWLRPF